MRIIALAMTQISVQSPVSSIASGPRLRTASGSANEPNAGFSQETEALLSVADQGYPLQLSMLVSALLPDGRPFHRLMREFSPTLPQDALNELRRSSGLRAHVPHGDGTLRVHEISLWGFSQAVDAMELRCRHFAESRGALRKDTCRRLLESERRQ